MTAAVVGDAVGTRSMRAVRATRYVTAFREGGSLPGLVEADDDGLYVVKFRGAGQGPRVLVAEWLAGEIARSLGLLVPDLVAVDLAKEIADSEPHQEIHDLLEASVGRNIGLDFLPGSLMYDPAIGTAPDPDWAASVVWLDALVTNPDRSARNPNMLVWHGRTWLIDHGAALFIHHTWRDPDAHARRSFGDRIGDHVLLPFASSIAAADERLAELVTGELLADLVAAVPDDWLAPDRIVGDADAQRRAYVRYLSSRLESPRPFVEAADRARAEAG
ncbi:MAG TPA: HipA family kinase [Candidatus Limnocylindrales bacterium]|nr:HipA family kinase [Candidatus Limnocylindrales bacterium]